VVLRDFLERRGRKGFAENAEKTKEKLNLSWFSSASSAKSLRPLRSKSIQAGCATGLPAGAPSPMWWCSSRSRSGFERLS
jgi:hypothetical protein